MYFCKSLQTLASANILKNDKNMKKEAIVVNVGEQSALAREFSVSRVTVHDALAGKTNSLMSAKIRHAALQRGGMYKSQVPTC